MDAGSLTLIVIFDFYYSHYAFVCLGILWIKISIIQQGIVKFGGKGFSKLMKQLLFFNQLTQYTCLIPVHNSCTTIFKVLTFVLQDFSWFHRPIWMTSSCSYKYHGISLRNFESKCVTFESALCLMMAAHLLVLGCLHAHWWLSRASDSIGDRHLNGEQSCVK